MLKLKLQYFGYLMQRADLFEKTLRLGKIEVRRRRGQQKTWWLDGITDTMDMGLGRVQELDREAWSAAVHGVAKTQTRLSDWTELNWTALGPRVALVPQCLGVAPFPSLWTVFNITFHLFSSMNLSMPTNNTTQRLKQFFFMSKS